MGLIFTPLAIRYLLTGAFSSLTFMVIIDRDVLIDVLLFVSRLHFVVLRPFLLLICSSVMLWLSFMACLCSSLSSFYVSIVGLRLSLKIRNLRDYVLMFVLFSEFFPGTEYFLRICNWSSLLFLESCFELYL